jgi:hypothetical protein
MEGSSHVQPVARTLAKAPALEDLRLSSDKYPIYGGLVGLRAFCATGWFMHDWLSAATRGSAASGGLTRPEPEPLRPPSSPCAPWPLIRSGSVCWRVTGPGGRARACGYVAGRKRNADQVPSIDTWRTGCTPWTASAATSRSRLRSVPSWPPLG